MKHYEGVVTLKTVPLLLTLTLIMPIFLSSCKRPEKNSNGLKDVLTSIEKNGPVVTPELKKQFLKELPKETFGLTK